MEPTAELREGLAVLFLDEPRGRSVEQQVRAGRRRLRRRRTVQAVGVAVSVLVALAGVAVAGSGTEREQTPVTTPTPSPSVDQDAAQAEAQLRLIRSLVHVDAHGRADVQEGVEVLRREDNFLDLPAPFTADAVEVRKGGDHFVLATTPGGMSFEHAEKQTLDQLMDQVRGYGLLAWADGGPMPLDIWQWGASPHPLPPVFDPGIKILRTVENPLHVEAPRTSVAYEVRGGAHTWWAIWEVGPSGRNGAMNSTEAGTYESFEVWLALQDVRTDW